jgi:hypothetical protein
MGEKFEQAEVYIKELLAVPIEMAVREVNKQLVNDRVVPGLILMVTGGQAIQNYFPNSLPLRTHDYDLKLISPSATKYTQVVRDRMLLISKGIARYIQLALNNYVKGLGIDLKKEIKDRFDVELVLDGNNDMFNVPENLERTLLTIITLKLKQKLTIRTNSIVDIFVSDPEVLSVHYKEFTGLDGSNPVLSEGNLGKYYIPYKLINGVPYAGMGYLIWDTYRMVEESRVKGLSKYSRYFQKRDAILNALNNPLTKVSCHAMKDYMLNCEQKYKVCVINDKKFKTADALIQFGISEGVLPADVEFIKNLRKTYDIDYLCESIRRMI